MTEENSQLLFVDRLVQKGLFNDALVILTEYAPVAPPAQRDAIERQMTALLGIVTTRNELNGANHSPPLPKFQPKAVRFTVIETPPGEVGARKSTRINSFSRPVSTLKLVFSSTPKIR